uniref:Uncharacterized protein n=1 Tax=Trypanosoma vivax (strain Y486) TaxID=1055687 RepID=G0U5Y4_TRYVY|nr:hypothetical protein TVY486_1003380 [Trypanosoma vivax Y486]
MKTLLRFPSSTLSLVLFRYQPSPSSLLWFFFFLFLLLVRFHYYFCPFEWGRDGGMAQETPQQRCIALPIAFWISLPNAISLQPSSTTKKKEKKKAPASPP